ncbi:MAG: hypothetical protein MPL62_10145 [Alphaproteobacteria bacterium]|nr:hypothetical protein [Alphaproteobacteria bacterium]
MKIGILIGNRGTEKVSGGGGRWGVFFGLLMARSWREFLLLASVDALIGGQAIIRTDEARSLAFNGQTTITVSIKSAFGLWH